MRRFFYNGFFVNVEKKPLWPGHGRKKIPIRFRCTAPSFIKRPIKEHAYEDEKRCEIFCYKPQLCDRAEKVNTHNKLNLKKSVRNIAKIMCGENKALMI